MLIPAMCKVVASPATIGSLWAIYRLSDADNTSKYIGYCKLSLLFQLPDAHRNSEFHNEFKNNETIIIDIISLAQSEQEAWEEQKRLVSLERPICNIKGIHTYAALFPIICRETGEVFRTLKDVSEAHGASTSNLSNHLNGHPGFKTVKGRTYYRGKPK